MALVPLQQVDPMRYEALMKAVPQTQATLNETNAAAGAAGASAALSNQSRINEVLQQPIRQAAKDQLDIINQAGDYFAKHADKNGYVSPKDYNNFLSQYNQKGGDSATFEKTFADRFIDPKNAFYDTPDAKLARSALPNIKNVVDSYFKLDKTGPQWQEATKIPVIGQWLKANMLAPEEAHNQWLIGQTGNIRQIAGAGSGQGFRFNLNELNNIASMLPSGYDTKAQANAKLDRLDTFLKSNMGTDLKTVLQGGAR